MIGLRIKEAREARGLTQAALAKGIASRTYISAIELGKIKPSAENLQIIAKRLGQPLSFFLEDSLEDALQRLGADLNQAKVLLTVGKIVEARELLHQIEAACKQTVHMDILALYHEVHGHLQQVDGALFQSVLSYTLASDAYIKSKQLPKAWECRYTAAFVLYQAGYMDQSISASLDAVGLLNDTQECESKALTHYLIGCAHFAKGDTHKARTFFTEARAFMSDTTIEAVLLALLGECSCMVHQGQWQSAHALSRTAAGLAEKHKSVRLKAEALIAVMVCCVHMGEYGEARQVFAQIASLPGAPISVKCKAYREMIFVTQETVPLENTACLETTLSHLLLSADTRLDNWERLKSEWALERCRLLRDPETTIQQVENFAESFCRIDRFKDAADALAFGAELLKKVGSVDEAYTMLSKAYALMQGKTC
jgi:transcriptional regulator with XRE-family HTH domain